MTLAAVLLIVGFGLLLYVTDRPAPREPWEEVEDEDNEPDEGELQRAADRWY